MYHTVATPTVTLRSPPQLIFSGTFSDCYNATIARSEDHIVPDQYGLDDGGIEGAV